MRKGEHMRPVREVVRRLPLSIRRSFATRVHLLLLFVGYEIAIRKRDEIRIKTLAQSEALHRMNEFLSIASHELKTPLTSIKGNVQLMERRLKRSLGAAHSLPTETAHTLMETQELLERTNQQITRLIYLVNTLLECARIHANTIDLLLEICELDTLIREVVQDSRSDPATCTLHLELPETMGLVIADASRSKQFAIHYLSNAHKYSELSQPITITLHEEGSMARVLVSDKGP